MSSENFDALRQIVLKDLSLQNQLRQLSRRADFVRRVVEIGAERGLPFGEEDVARAMRDNRRVWIERWI